jgi:hypothetical protein
MKTRFHNVGSEIQPTFLSGCIASIITLGVTALIITLAVIFLGGK